MGTRFINLVEYVLCMLNVIFMLFCWYVLCKYCVLKTQLLLLSTSEFLVEKSKLPFRFVYTWFGSRQLQTKLLIGHGLNFLTTLKAFANFDGVSLVNCEVV